MFLWDDAERVAVPLIAGIKTQFRDDHVFYVGASMDPKGSSGYVRETVACMLDPDRNPVIFSDVTLNRFTVDEIFDTFQFQVVEMYSSIKMFETSIHRALQDQPGRLWLAPRLGKYCNKPSQVPRSLPAKQQSDGRNFS